MPSPRNPRKRRRNPVGILDTFLAGLGGSVGGALGAAVETIVISAGAVAVDRMLSKGGRQPVPTISPLLPDAVKSPEAFDRYLRSSKLAPALSMATILQMGTIPDTAGTHEVVYALAGYRLAARITATGQITLKNLPMTAPAPTTVPTAPPVTQTPMAPADALNIIDCEPAADGTWEPV